MKRILFFCAAMLAVLTCNAQSVQVLKDGKVIAEFYERDGWEFVFKEKEGAEDPYNGHEYVDLGLPSGLKWATMNVGATKPEEYGDYYAWGETEPYYAEGHSQDNPCKVWREGKTGYNWASYFDSVNGSGSSFDRYALGKKTTLDADDDVAHVKWGGDWRMPTEAEQNELCEKCTWELTTQNGVYGEKVTGPNGNSIFLPAAGYRGDSWIYNAGSSGHYWVSSLHESYSGSAYELLFSSDCVRRFSNYRYYGQSVRAVCP